MTNGKLLILYRCRAYFCLQQRLWTLLWPLKVRNGQNFYSDRPMAGIILCLQWWFLCISHPRTDFSVLSRACHRQHNRDFSVPTINFSFQIRHGGLWTRFLCRDNVSLDLVCLQGGNFYWIEPVVWPCPINFLSMRCLMNMIVSAKPDVFLHLAPLTGCLPGIFRLPVLKIGCGHEKFEKNHTCGAMHVLSRRQFYVGQYAESQFWGWIKVTRWQTRVWTALLIKMQYNKQR